MEAMFSAFAVGAFAEMGDKTQLLALALGVHFRRFFPVIAGITIAAMANMALAAAGGLYVAPYLTPVTARLLMALALGFAALDAFCRLKEPDPIENWKLGAFGSSLILFFIMELGDKTQFLSFAIGASSGTPVLTAVCATAGIVLTSAIAIRVAHDFEDRVPMRSMRMGVGVVFAIGAIVAALSALPLI